MFGGFTAFVCWEVNVDVEGAAAAVEAVAAGVALVVAGAVAVDVAAGVDAAVVPEVVCVVVVVVVGGVDLDALPAEFLEADSLNTVDVAE